MEIAKNEPSPKDQKDDMQHQDESSNKDDSESKSELIFVEPTIEDNGINELPDQYDELSQLSQEDDKTDSQSDSDSCEYDWSDSSSDSGLGSEENWSYCNTELYDWLMRTFPDINTTYNTPVSNDQS